MSAQPDAPVLPVDIPDSKRRKILELARAGRLPWYIGPLLHVPQSTVRQVLQQDGTALRKLIGSALFVFTDEAQR
jgi:hypothetical protein